MRLRMTHIFTLAFVIVSFFVVAQGLYAQEPLPTIHLLERDDCTYCQAEKKYLADLVERNPRVVVKSHDIINDPEAKKLFSDVTESAGIPKVTPITIIGNTVIQGFQSPETTGKIMEKLLEEQIDQDLNKLVAEGGLIVSSAIAPGCDEDGNVCGIDNPNAGSTISVPFIGDVSTAGFSLVALSALLGFVDGFNPCAMWVLITFLLILSQIGDRVRMIQIAGLFIVAEGIMYNLILNVWYTAWDFVALDRIVTPVVGFIALAGGIFFLHRWWKSGKQIALVCEVTEEDQQKSLMERMKKVATGPLTIVTALGIIGIAFSVNIIEFACSIGIPQAYTKILELNDPSFILRQFYLAIYTLMYMVDDIIVFLIAIWGFGRLQAHGAKYARWSALIGGIALLILGIVLIFAPNLLVLA
jgi:uncharacterized protein (UPF0333 family)/glutaredoxin